MSLFLRAASASDRCLARARPLSAAQASAARVGVERQGLLRSGHPSVGETGLGTARLRQGQPASTHDSPSHAPDLVAPTRNREPSGASPPHVFSSRGIDDAGRVRLLFPRAPPPSSSGLGYQVLILKTGVQVPLGVSFRRIIPPAVRPLPGGANSAFAVFSAIKAVFLRLASCVTAASLPSERSRLAFAARMAGHDPIEAPCVRRGNLTGGFLGHGARLVLIRLPG